MYSYVIKKKNCILIIGIKQQEVHLVYLNIESTTSYNLQTFFFISSQSSTIEERNSKIREWSKFTVCLSVFYLYAELENDPSLLSVCLSVWEHF